jgi:hypothetical protein
MFYVLRRRYFARMDALHIKGRCLIFAKDAVIVTILVILIILLIELICPLPMYSRRILCTFCSAGATVASGV